MTNKIKKCYLCGSQAEISDLPLTPSMYYVKCECCGIYEIAEEATHQMHPTGLLPSASETSRLSGVTREQTEIHQERNITKILPATIQELLNRAPKPFDIPGKARKLLRAIARRSDAGGHSVALTQETDYTLSYSPPTPEGEFRFVVQYIESEGWITNSSSLHGESIIITPQGWEELSKSSHTDSTKAFVAMWIDDQVTTAYTDGIAPACEHCGFRAVRIDTEEFIGDIPDQIIAEIKESRFAVCDLTGHREGVYFEAGYAMGLGIPVIWTCRDDEAKKTHFDAEHFNQIRWKTIEELREKLTIRIRAVIGTRPKSPGGNERWQV